MLRRTPSLMALALIAAASLLLISCVKQTPAPPPVSEQDQLARGKYLVDITGCNDCHTPGCFYGAPDASRALAGSDLGWQGPWGVSFARNLTPEPQTGIAAWTESDIVAAIRTGKRPDGRMLLPPMPWPDFAHMTDDDAMAIAKYLKSIPPVQHKVPDIIPPGTKAKGSIVVFPPPSAWDAPRAPAAAGADTTRAH